MASFHLSAEPIQRSKGFSAVAAAAYRAGDELHDERTGETHDYRRKRGVFASAILAPDNAPEWVQDREELWNKAELAEKRKDAQPAREVRLALPAELTDEQRADLAFDFCRDVFVSQGMIADISIHRPDRDGDDRNHHAHVLLTMRELDGGTFSANKQREWNSKELLADWREQWADYQNRALEKYGHDARVDHRSLAEQGITDRLPQEHHGKGGHMQDNGRESDRVQQYQQNAANYANLKAEHAAVTAALAELEENSDSSGGKKIVLPASRQEAAGAAGSEGKSTQGNFMGSADNEEDEKNIHIHIHPQQQEGGGSVVSDLFGVFGEIFSAGREFVGGVVHEVVDFVQLAREEYTNWKVSREVEAYTDAVDARNAQRAAATEKIIDAEFAEVPKQQVESHAPEPAPQVTQYQNTGYVNEQHYEDKVAAAQQFYNQDNSAVFHEQLAKQQEREREREHEAE